MTLTTCAIIAILSVEIALATIVFTWAAWVALTQGDDVIARFGRRILKR